MLLHIAKREAALIVVSHELISDDSETRFRCLCMSKDLRRSYVKVDLKRSSFEICSRDWHVDELRNESSIEAQ